MSFCKVCKPSVPNLPISCLILSCIENPGEGIFVGRLAEESKKSMGRPKQGKAEILLRILFLKVGARSKAERKVMMKDLRLYIGKP